MPNNGRSDGGGGVNRLSWSGSRAVVAMNERVG